MKKQASMIHWEGQIWTSWTCRYEKKTRHLYLHHLYWANRNRKPRWSVNKESANGLEIKISSGTNLKFTDLTAMTHNNQHKGTAAQVKFVIFVLRQLFHIFSFICFVIQSDYRSSRPGPSVKLVITKHIMYENEKQLNRRSNWNTAVRTVVIGIHHPSEFFEGIDLPFRKEGHVIEMGVTTFDPHWDVD